MCREEMLEFVVGNGRGSGPVQVKAKALENLLLGRVWSNFPIGIRGAFCRWSMHVRKLMYCFGRPDVD